MTENFYGDIPRRRRIVDNTRNVALRRYISTSLIFFTCDLTYSIYAMQPNRVRLIHRDALQYVEQFGINFFRNSPLDERAT